MLGKLLIIPVLAVALASCGSEPSSIISSPEIKMIAIQGGSFQMGCSHPIADCEDNSGWLSFFNSESVQGCYTSYFDCEKDEKPVHSVTIKPFFMSETEVTFAQWDACVAGGGCRHKPDDEGWGRGLRPVMNVSWNDAQEYVKWLSKEKGKTYRLPTEAEWEYAARAGTTTKYSFGNNKAELCRYANHSDKNGDYIRRNTKCSDGIGEKTAQVGSYHPNQWGLYDMHGNVSEWTCSASTKTYNGSESQCINTSDFRVRAATRGGAWTSMAEHLRSESRGSLNRNERYNMIGFRVVRTH